MVESKENGKDRWLEESHALSASAEFVSMFWSFCVFGKIQKGQTKYVRVPGGGSDAPRPNTSDETSYDGLLLLEHSYHHWHILGCEDASVAKHFGVKSTIN